MPVARGALVGVYHDDHEPIYFGWDVSIGCCLVSKATLFVTRMAVLTIEGVSDGLWLGASEGFPVGPCGVGLIK